MSGPIRTPSDDHSDVDDSVVRLRFVLKSQRKQKKVQYLSRDDVNTPETSLNQREPSSGPTNVPKRSTTKLKFKNQSSSNTGQKPAHNDSDDTISDMETESEEESDHKPRLFTLRTPVGSNTPRIKTTDNSLPRGATALKQNLLDSDESTELDSGSLDGLPSKTPRKRQKTREDRKDYHLIGKNGEKIFVEPKTQDEIVDPYKLFNGLDNNESSGAQTDPIEVKYRELEARKNLEKGYDDYLKSWTGEVKYIHWPGKEGTYEAISMESLRDFFMTGSKKIAETSGIEPLDGEGLKKVLLTVLKYERIRWHPDKMVQMLEKAGILDGGVNDDIIKSRVTSVFQMINAVYEDEGGSA